MVTIAFIGLGVMGAPMATNLVRSGFDVVGFNRSPEKLHRLAAVGVRAASDVGSAVRGADVVATMLPDSPDVEGVLAGEAGVFEVARPGTLVIDFSTIRPDTARSLHARGAARGLRLLDAPVSGGEVGAKSAGLSIMVGGDAVDYEAAQPVLRALGDTIVHVGPAGCGQTVKAANQLVVAGHLELLAEAIVLLESHKVDTEAALRVLGGGLAGSKVLQLKGASMRARQFQPGFRVDLHCKDLGIVSMAAEEVGLTLPLTTVVTELMGALREQGDGDLDHSALLRGLLRLTGGYDAQPAEPNSGS